ncbi:hypothetical protein HAT2_00335 [Candidatus Similichlamydia laticola]|uniref:Thioredoxin domain-containing protein n=2 Tax=Candidatus Similichlamydia laticola TaxID=2170265 RepID=A0A369KD49_9BACT|nr:hypothetical protein HAT2_00335 [Candidatus Similichlamydia laticola]
MHYSIPMTSLKDRCHSNLELASKTAQEEQKWVLAFVYPSQDMVIENFLTGAAESVLRKLAKSFVFYTMEVQQGLLSSCSEKSFLLEGLQVTRLPTILVLNPSTSKVRKRIERPEEGALTEELLMKNLEVLLKEGHTICTLSTS